MPMNGFIKIDRKFWRSDAVEALSPAARLLLVELHYRFTGRNNGRICMSWAEGMSTLQCSRATVGRKFAELRQAGLIEITVKGSFDHKGGARKGTCNQYNLTCLKGK